MYAKIAHLSIRTYPSKIQYICYVSSSICGSPTPGRRAAMQPCSQITFGRLVIIIIITIITIKCIPRLRQTCHNKTKTSIDCN